MSKRVLVLGGTGLVGSAVAFVLKKAGWDFAITSQGPGGPVACITHYQFSVTWNCNRTRNDLKRILDKFHPTIVINALKAADLDESFSTNIVIPHIVVNECKRSLINISSDAVFAPAWKSYKATSVPQPATWYGFLKLAGERITPQTSIRTSVVGVPLWVEDVQKSLKRLYPAQRWTGRLWKGSTNLHLALFILRLLEANGLTNRILHFAPSEALALRDVFGLLFSAFGVDRPKLSTGTCAGMILSGCESWDKLLSEQVQELALALLQARDLVDSV